MRAAFVQARRALGQCSPNPAVGAVIVRQDETQDVVIATGHTMPGGRPHAERKALDQAGKGAEGATLYVTLEPCAHHGKTPPCVDAIIKSGISRVVSSVADPDPRVAGKGVETLKRAGVETVEGCLESEGANIVRGHVLRVTQKRPLIQLKLAVGSDGLVPQGKDGAPVWITGEEARAHGHLLRARADAILVGHGTVLADNPSLTCRLPGMGDRSPVRVVLASALELPVGSKLLKDIDEIPLWVAGAESAERAAEETLTQAGAEVLRLTNSATSGLDIGELLAALAERGITRLLVEGGPRVAASFWNAGLADELYIYQGCDSAGSDGIMPFTGVGLGEIENSVHYEKEATRALGRDTLSVYRRKSES